MVDYICKTNPIAPSLLNSEDKGRKIFLFLGRVGPQARKHTPPANPIRVTYMGECVKEII